MTLCALQASFHACLRHVWLRNSIEDLCLRNYNESVSSSYKGAQPGSLYPYWTKFQYVSLQWKSPVVNGKLKLVANPLRYERREEKIHVGALRRIGAMYSSPAALPFNRYAEDTIRNEFRNDIIAMNNKWIDKAQGFGTNLIDIYRTRYETVGMVTSTVRRLTTAFKYVKRKRWRDACATLGIEYKKPTRKNRDNAPGAWLEYTYGWSPLCSDVYLAINQLFPELKTRVATGKDGMVTKYREVRIRPLVVLMKEEWTFRGRVVGTLVCNNTTVKAASYFGIDNPTLAMWEAMPYSFVVDWFIPIGDYLSSLTAFHGVSVINCSSSVRLETYQYPVEISGTPELKDYNINDPADGWFKHTYFNRTIGTPKFRFPQPDNGLSLSRFASALSLMAKAFERHY